MAERAFPVVFAQDVGRSAVFYEHLGFERHVGLPQDGEPGYVGLRRGTYELAVVSAGWPQQQYDLSVGADVRFELFVYVDVVDVVVDGLGGSGATILRAAEDMPWGERVAYVTDPDGNPVALASAATGAGSP